MKPRRGTLGCRSRRSAAGCAGHGGGSSRGYASEASRQPVPAMHSPSGIESFVPATPALPPILVKSTIHHAVWWSSMAGLIGERAGVPASIAVLARGVLRSMFLSACRVPGIVALLCGRGRRQSRHRRAGGAPDTRGGIKAGNGTCWAIYWSTGSSRACPAARSGSRVIQGRLTDSQGRRVRGGKIMFGATDKTHAVRRVDDSRIRRRREIPDRAFGISIRFRDSSGDRPAALPRAGVWVS